ncbi:hypothetical protein ACF061_05020 [Streptomyces sp. NPDC015220]|uniref:hypothetical protein n=1 Tax=Streptomyces sp. NPDC015220 TaxID=3364947 RepID=UPI0036FD9FDD
MPADEVTHGIDVDESRARTGPRHAAPKKPLFTRFHMPAGKAMAMAAMPTAVLMGMGFTASLAVADNNKISASSSETMNADDYKACVEALKGDKDTSSPTPSASASATDTAEDGTPSPSATSSTGKTDGSSADTGTDSPVKAAPGASSSSDSGSDDKAQPSASATGSKSGPGDGDGGASPAPSASETKSGGLLDTIGDTIGDIGNILTGGKSGLGADAPAGAAPTPSASASPSASAAGNGSGGSLDSVGKTASDTVKDTTGKVVDTAGDSTGKVADTVEDTVKDATDKAQDATDKAQDATDKASGDATDKAGDATGTATASPSPSPSASASTDAEDCPAATDAEGGVDNTMPLADDPWYLNASSLTLKGASYKGIVEVKTANGTVKKVLKYVISGGTDIVDLHQTVQDKQAGRTYHVQAAKGSTSKITGGDTVMYTESISGNLLGLIPITFSPDNPPPLDIPLIIFTKVKVVQAGQFGGNLNIPGMHLYTTDGV